jgi:hypothetical protein
LFILEQTRYPVGVKTPPHFDGLVDERYYQINGAFAQRMADRKTQNMGTSYVMERYTLPEGQIKLLPVYNREDRRLAREYGVSYSKEDRRKDGRPKKGIFDKFREEGLEEPVLTNKFTGFVPLGAVIIFVNGSGVDNRLFLHHTSSAQRIHRFGIFSISQDPEFRRSSHFGRVVGPQTA